MKPVHRYLLELSSLNTQWGPWAGLLHNQMIPKSGMEGGYKCCLLCPKLFVKYFGLLNSEFFTLYHSETHGWSQKKCKSCVSNLLILNTSKLASQETLSNQQNWGPFQKFPRPPPCRQEVFGLLCTNVLLASVRSAWLSALRAQAVWLWEHKITLCIFFTT